MRIKLKLRSKMLLSVVAAVAIIFIISFNSLTTRLETVTLNNAYSYIDATTRENANSIRANLEHEMGLCRAIAQSFNDFHTMNKEEIIETTKQITRGIAQNNPNILATWASWEIWAIDKDWDKPYGRDRLTYFWDNNELKFQFERLNTEGDDVGSSYTQIKHDKKEVIMNPYWNEYNDSTEKVFETSMCIPLIYNNKFAGLFGFDFGLDRYQPDIESINPYKGSNAMLISQNGTIVAHTNPNFVGCMIDSILKFDSTKTDLLDSIYNGKNFSFINTNSLGQECYLSFSSINVSSVQNHWSLAVITPKDILVLDAKQASKRSQTLIILGLVFLALVVGILTYGITRPLIKVNKLLRILAEGQIDVTNKLNINSGDEIEDIGNSLNTLIDSLDKTTKFAKEIGRGNLNAPFQKLSNNDDLGESLLEMRKSLEHSKELDESRKVEEEKERWANEGIAKFAEILRSNTNNMEEFTYSVINNVVNYVGANIGGIYLLNTDNKNDRFFELKGCFAYDRRKHENKRIEINEGLVGRCAKEGEIILMTELPDDYIKIATGLGHEKPSCLLLVPMKLNDEVFGVIELAAFEVIEDYKVKFIEKIGESIAATISNVKTNLRTAQLLEDSRIKSEELSTQEEEMRQNMEELQATQEEAARKTAEMESLINALNTSSYVVEYDINGTILSVNQAYLTLTHQSEKSLIGTHHADNINFSEEQKVNYQKFWSDLQNGIIKKETNTLTIDNNEYTFIETYSPIYDENHKVKKILKIAHNITDFIGDKAAKKLKK